MRFVFAIVVYQVGAFNSRKVNRLVNKSLKSLQERGATIVDVKQDLTNITGRTTYFMTYLVTYEAKEPLVVPE